MATETPAEFEIVPLPRMRHLVIDVLRAAQRKHMIHGLVEADVTRARQYIREQEASTGEQLSFTAFVATCLGKAVDMNKYLYAMRNWRGQLVLFDEVDVSTMIEVEVEGRKIPMAHILRSDRRGDVWRGRRLGDPPCRLHAQRYARRYWNNADAHLKRNATRTVARDGARGGSEH